HYVNAAAADGPATVLALPVAAIERLARAEAAFSHALAAAIAARLRRHLVRAEGLLLRRLSARLAAFLHGFAARGGARPGVPCVLDRNLTLDTVAAMIQATREEVSRTMRLLSEAKLIRFDRKTITVVDLDRLRGWAFGEEGSDALAPRE
ncbi:MAG: winged helix-turn-helix domain-containing protein, partial [Planctomycetes bacterium]|nr:winged helix-turn-helix domain-containing protein [Planctomycetota bacterium]